MKDRLLFSKVQFLFLVLTFPFWSLPFFPGTYSSGFHIFLMVFLPFSIFLYRGKIFHSIDIFHFSLIPVFLLSLAINIESQWLSTSSFLRGFISWLILILGVISFRSTIIRVGFKSFTVAFRNLGVFLVGLAIFQLIVISFGLQDHINSIFESISGKPLVGRITLTTSEPSWAALLNIILFPFLVHDYLERRSTFSLMWCVGSIFVLMVLLSLQGYLILLMGALIYFVFFEPRGAFRFSIYVLIFALLGTIVLWVSLDEVGRGGPYYISRMFKLVEVFSDSSVNLFFSIISLDGSLFVRLGYPFVALVSFLDNPFGLGVGQFGNAFPIYYSAISVYDPGSNEVVAHLDNLNADPRNFILLLLSDSGIVGGLIGAGYFYYSYRMVLGVSEYKKRVLLGMLFSFSLPIMFQFSTPYFCIYILVAASIQAFGSRVFVRRI